MDEPTERPQSPPPAQHAVTPTFSKIHPVSAVVPDDALAALDGTIARLVAEDPEVGGVFARWVETAQAGARRGTGR